VTLEPPNVEGTSPRKARPLTSPTKKRVQFVHTDDVREYMPSQPVALAGLPSHTRSPRPVTPRVSDPSHRTGADLTSKNTRLGMLGQQEPVTRERVEAKVHELLAKLGIRQQVVVTNAHSPKASNDRAKTAPAQTTPTETTQADHASTSAGEQQFTTIDTKSATQANVETDREALAALTDKEALKEVFGEMWLVAKRDLTALFSLPRPEGPEKPLPPMSIELQPNSAGSSPRAKRPPSELRPQSFPLRRPFIAGSVAAKPADISKGEVQHDSSQSSKPDSKPLLIKVTQGPQWRKRLLHYLQRYRLAEVRAVRSREQACVELCELRLKLEQLRDKLRLSGSISASTAVVPASTSALREMPPRWLAQEAYETGGVREAIVEATTVLAEHADRLASRRNELLAKLEEMRQQHQQREQELDDAITKLIGPDSSAQTTAALPSTRRKQAEEKANTIVGTYIAKSVDDTLIGDPALRPLIREILELQATRHKQATDHAHWMDLARSEAKRRRRLFAEALEERLLKEKSRLDQEWAEHLQSNIENVAKDIAKQAELGASMIYKMTELDAARMFSAEMGISDAMLSPDICLAALQRDMLCVIEENKRIHNRIMERRQALASKKAELSEYHAKAQQLEKECQAVDDIVAARVQIEKDISERLAPEMRSLVWQNVVLEDMVSKCSTEIEQLESTLKDCVDLVSAARVQAEMSVNAKLAAMQLLDPRASALSPQASQQATVATQTD